MEETPEKHPEFDPETYTQYLWLKVLLPTVSIPHRGALQSMSSTAHPHLWVATSL